MTQIDDAVSAEREEEEKAQENQGEGKTENDIMLFEERMELLMDHGGAGNLGTASANLMGASGLMKRIKGHASGARQARADHLASQLAALVESNTADDKEVETVNILAALAAVGKIRGTDDTRKKDGGEHSDANKFADQLSALVSNIDSKDPEVQASNLLAARSMVKQTKKMSGGAQGSHADALAQKLAALLQTVDPDDEEGQVANVLASVSMLGQVRRAAGNARGAQADKLACNVQQLVNSSSSSTGGGMAGLSRVNVLAASGVVKEVKAAATRAKGRSVDQKAAKLQSLLSLSAGTSKAEATSNAANLLGCTGLMKNVRDMAKNARGNRAQSKAKQLATLIEKSRNGDPEAIAQLHKLMAATTLVKQVKEKAGKAQGIQLQPLSIRLGLMDEESDDEENEESVGEAGFAWGDADDDLNDFLGLSAPGASKKKAPKAHKKRKSKRASKRGGATGATSKRKKSPGTSSKGSKRRSTKPKAPGKNPSPPGTKKKKKKK
jgi:hypothetical protein